MNNPDRVVFVALKAITIKGVKTNKFLPK